MDANARIAEKNRQSWNAFSGRYLAYFHSDRFLLPLASDPSRAFHGEVWRILRDRYPDFSGMRILVPSSGDNVAVFAFALLGARVTSCDISENQLDAASQVAEHLGISDSIDFLRTDTMGLLGALSGAYDLVFTSNGVHVWLSDLPAAYRAFYRALKPGGRYLMYEIHPFLRPFDDDLHIRKPYDMVGPFEDESDVTFAWRVQDIVNAMLDSGLRLTHMEELFAEKDYETPFWLRTEDIVNGATATREEVDRMYDWRNNPAMALPNWICLEAKKD